MRHQPHLKKWLLFAGKVLVLVLLAWFLRAALLQAFADLKRYKWSLQPAWLGLAGGLYVLGYSPVVWFWYRALRGAGQDVGRFETFRAWWVSQPAKYVPGKAMVLVLRAGLLQHGKLELTVVMATVFMETLASMAVASLVSLVLLTWDRRQTLSLAISALFAGGGLVDFAQNKSVILVAAAAGMFVATALPIWPPVMGFLVRLLGVGKLNPTAADKLARVPRGLFFAGCGLMAVGWMLHGLGLWATLRAIGEDGWPPQQLAMDIVAVAMATVAGFLSLIPGGAGVREIVQTEILATHYAEGPALVATILWRLVMLVTELLLAIMLYGMGPRRLKHKLGGDVPPGELN